MTGPKPTLSDNDVHALLTSTARTILEARLNAETEHARKTLHTAGLAMAAFSTALVRLMDEAEDGPTEPPPSPS
jgi:hypothetical protein